MTSRELMDLIDRSLFASLGYVDGRGKMCIRRVFCTWHKGLTRHLISTNTSSSHAQRLLTAPDACLYFSDDAAFEGFCLTGRAIVHREPEWKKLLWHDGDEKYYPLGVDDPDYCILEFVADEGAYYRFDGKGVLSRDEMEAYFPDAVFEDGYARRAQEAAKK